MLLLLFVCNTISESSKSCLWGYFFLLILVPLPVPFMLSLISLAIPVSTHSRTVGKEAAPGFLCSVLYCLRVHTLTVHIDRKDFLQRNTAWPSPCQDVVGGLDSGEQWEPVSLGTYQGPCQSPALTGGWSWCGSHGECISVRDLGEVKSPKSTWTSLSWDSSPNFLKKRHNDIIWENSCYPCP